MHRFVLLLAALPLLISCNKQAEVTVMNLSEADRQEELVEICLCSLKKTDPARLVILDSLGNELPVQLLYKGESHPQAFVFPVTVGAGRKVVYTIMERETVDNTLNAYGGELTDDAMLERALSVGVIAPYSEDSIWTLGRYSRYKVLDKGAFRSSLVLYYDSVPYGTHILTAEIQVNMDAGSYLNEYTVRFSGDSTQLRLANGVPIQDPLFELNGHPERGYVGLSFKAGTPEMRFVGMVFVNRLAEMKRFNGTIACISHYMQGEWFRYFAGQTTGDDTMTSERAWFAFLAQQRQIQSNPLDIRIDR